MNIVNIQYRVSKISLIQYIRYQRFVVSYIMKVVFMNMFFQYICKMVEGNVQFLFTSYSNLCGVNVFFIFRQYEGRMTIWKKTCSIYRFFLFLYQYPSRNSLITRSHQVLKIMHNEKSCTFVKTLFTTFNIYLFSLLLI